MLQEQSSETDVAKLTDQRRKMRAAQVHSDIYTLKNLCYLSQVESGWRGFSTLCWWQTHQQRVCILLRSPSTLIPNATPPSPISSHNWLQSHWNADEFHWILILSKFKIYINILWRNWWYKTVLILLLEITHGYKTILFGGGFFGITHQILTEHVF